MPLSVIPAFWAMQRDGLLAQLRQPARHHPGDRHPGRRRHRRDREHRPPHADGQTPYDAAIEAADEIGLAVVAITCTIIADLRAGQLHGRHRRAVFQAVRPDRRGRGVLLAAGRAPDHADDGRLPAQARPRAPGARGLACMRAYTGFLRGHAALPRADTDGRRSALFAGSIWSTSLLPTGLHPAPRRGAHRHVARTAAGRDASRTPATRPTRSRPPSASCRR